MYRIEYADGSVVTGVVSVEAAVLMLTARYPEASAPEGDAPESGVWFWASEAELEDVARPLAVVREEEEDEPLRSRFDELWQVLRKEIEAETVAATNEATGKGTYDPEEA
jgi:hypothetical protein